MFFRLNFSQNRRDTAEIAVLSLKARDLGGDKKSPKTLDVMLVFGHGAGGGTRTHTLSPTTDFESVTSANSITPAHLQSLREQISENGGMLGGM